MRHATSVFEAFGYISGRGLARESVWPVGQIMIWTVLELQERETSRSPIKAYREVDDHERADALYARLTAAYAKRSRD
jgi:hypothetical protein